MKRTSFKSATVAMAAAALCASGLAACSNAQKGSADSTAADSSAASDTILVEETAAAATPGINPYSAEFFLNDANKADATSAADSTYVVTPSGLRYAVIKEGTGKSPAATDVVTVNYEGKLTDMDGTVFDSSYRRGEPATFPLNGVIKGWTEGLQLMKEGAVYEFYIPASLAYGEQGGGPIPPNAPLIFQVELIKVGE